MNLHEDLGMNLDGTESTTYAQEESVGHNAVENEEVYTPQDHKDEKYGTLDNNITL